MPRTPDARPCGKPLPLKPAQTKTLSTGASGKQPDRTEPAPSGSRQGSTSNQGGQPSTSGQGGMTTAPRQRGKSSTPRQSSNRPPQAEVGHQQPQEIPPIFPQVGEEQVMVTGPTGMKCTCARPRVESLSLQGLPI